MQAQRGSALVLALMMLAFLMILGAAMLTSVNLEVAIGENYRSGTQLLYLAELGIDEARSTLLRSPRTASELLREAAGADGVLSASRNLETLLDVSDDIPLINGGDRSTGRLLQDTSGRTAGRVYVFLRNDAADGIRSPSDSNHVLTLLSVAVLGNSRKVVEVTVMKWRFPQLPAPLVLAGSPARFAPADAVSEISTIGVLTSEDRAAVLPGIPPPSDVAVIESLLDPRLRTPAGAERMVDRIVANASDRFDPGWDGTSVLGSLGASNDYRIVVVNGNCVLGTGTGFGVLLVRGNLGLSGSFRWNGLILVIGQGSIASVGTGSGVVSGGVFVMRTRASDRSANNALGSLLPTAGPVDVNFSGTGSSIQLENPGTAAMDLVNQKFPYLPIAVREY